MKNYKMSFKLWNLNRKSEADTEPMTKKTQEYIAYCVNSNN